MQSNKSESSSQHHDGEMGWSRGSLTLLSSTIFHSSWGILTYVSSFRLLQQLEWSPEPLRFLPDILDRLIRWSAYSSVNAFHGLSGAGQLLRNENQVSLTELGPAVEP
jgi:hypothetical protein